MKLNRFMAFALIAVLAVGAMGFVSSKVFAKSPAVQAQQVQQPTPDVEDPSVGLDTDGIQDQVGEQAEDGQPDAAEPIGASDTGVDEQVPNYSGSTAVDQTTTEGMSETDESAALAGQAKITADQAKAAALAANPGTTVDKVDLENENGTLVYGVELSNGADVKVDAGNGSILYTDTGIENEG